MSETTPSTGRKRTRSKTTKIMLQRDNEDLQSRLDVWRAMGIVARWIASESDHETVMNESVRDAAKALRADLFAVFTLDQTGSELTLQASIGLEAEAVRSLPVLTGQTLPETIVENLPGWALPEGLSELRELGERSQVRVLRHRNVTVGLLITARGANRFTADELHVLDGLAQQIGAYLYQEDWSKSLRAGERMERELHFAHAIKAQFLPDDMPGAPKLTPAVQHLRSLDAGGDFFDALSLPDGRYIAVLGECSGRGFNSALQSARILHDLRGGFARHESFPELIRRLNERITREGQRGQLVNLCLLEIDFREVRARCIRVGNTNVYLLTGRKIVADLDTDGAPLGVLLDYEATMHEHALKPGMAYVLATDGLAKVLRDRGLMDLPELFSDESFQEIGTLGAFAKTPLAQQIGHWVTCHGGPAVLADDTTVMSIEYTS